jgi:large subunit ribosomal protein L3
LKKAQAGNYLKYGLPPKEHLFTFSVTPENFLPIGYMMGPKHFSIGQFVDVKAVNIGKGTQGVMKRWNMSGGFATHGNSKAHRSIGSIGQCEFPGKVWKGRKMAGRMGNKMHTVLNQMVVKVDNKRSLLYVRGQVPGPISSVVRIRDAAKKVDKQYKTLQYPTWVEGRDREMEPSWTWEGAESDPREIYIHENDVVSGKDDGDD